MYKTSQKIAEREKKEKSESQIALGPRSDLIPYRWCDAG